MPASRSRDAGETEPERPGDLPPLPSRFYKARPRPACPQCGKRFGSVQELNEHARRDHPAEASGAGTKQ